MFQYGINVLQKCRVSVLGAAVSQRRPKVLRYQKIPQPAGGRRAEAGSGATTGPLGGDFMSPEQG